MNKQYQNYPIAPERRSEISRSLREHGLTTVDGVLCWTDNTTGEVISVDLDFFWACGIDLRLHIDPTTTEHAEESTRKALERLAAWCKQRELNDRIRDDTRGKFIFLELKRKNTQIGIQNIDFSTLARLCTLSAYLEYANKKTKKVKTDKQTKSDAQDDSMEVTTECEKTQKVVNESADKKEKKKNTIMRTANRSHAQATERDIRKILNLPTTTWRKFWQECKTQGYITGNDQDGYQLIDIFRYGRLDRRRTTKIQKLYVEAFIRLYRHGRIIGPNTNRALKNSDHRLIGALIYLAAYHMCPATNEIVANPDEPDQYKLTPLDEMGIAAALGYRVEAGHAMREVNKLRDLTFRLTDNGPDLYCLARVEAGRRRNNVRYIINPALIYAGDRANYNPIMQGLHWFVDDKNKKQDSA